MRGRMMMRMKMVMIANTCIHLLVMFSSTISMSGSTLLIVMLRGKLISGSALIDILLRKKERAVTLMGILHVGIKSNHKTEYL